MLTKKQDKRACRNQIGEQTQKNSGSINARDGAALLKALQVSLLFP